MENDTLATYPIAKLPAQESLSMGAQLHRVLRAAIIQGDLAPGQAISELETSRRFSMSRQPVREAFIKLAEEMLIEVLPQRGTYVRKISVKRVLEARHLREIIEVSIMREIATTLAARPDAGLIRTLRSLAAQQQKIKAGDRRDFLALDEEFHKTLALYAGREYAWRVIEGSKAQMDRVRFLSYDFATPTPQVVAEHTAIVDAIEAGDPDLAARTIENHLRVILDSLPQIAARYPEHFVDE